MIFAFLALGIISTVMLYSIAVSLGIIVDILEEAQEEEE